MINEAFVRDLRGKRLLYLGGISRARYVVERARLLGLYVIVADYNSDSPAKAVADEGALVNAMDVNAVVDLGRKKKIDGIMTGYSDILLPVCKAVAEKLHIPCYYSEFLLQMTLDKNSFEAVCVRYGLPVARRYEIDESNVEKSKDALTYPVFIKPIDASGSRGAVACNTRDEFVEKFNWSRTFSKGKGVLVEELLYGVEFILDYAIINGVAYLMSMADRYSSPGRPVAVNSPNLMVLPSKFLDRYNKNVHPTVQNLVKQEKIKDGILFFQGYSNEQKISFYESGCRLGGTWPYIVEHFSGLNPMDLLFEHAVCGKMLPAGVNNTLSANFSGRAAIIYFLANRPSGEIAEVNGVSEVERFPWTVHLMQFYYPGDRFDMIASRVTDIRLLSVFIVASNFDELKHRIKMMYEQIDFLDREGKSILMPPYDVDTLIGY